MNDYDAQEVLAGLDAAVAHLDSLDYSTKVYSTVVLVAEALRRGIGVTKAKTGKGLVLRSADRTRVWRTTRVPLNSELARRVCKFKNTTSALLTAQGVAAAQNSLFAPEQEDQAWQWAKGRLPVVIKPNDGLQGRDVHVGITGRARFGEIYTDLAREYGEVLVEKQYTGAQYRCFFVSGQLVAAALMRPASVVGDGKHTLAEMVDQKNLERCNHRSHRPLPTEPDPQLDLPELNEYIPAPGQRIYLTAVSNLQRGGDAIDATEDLTAEQEEFLQSVIAAIPNLHIAGVDVIFNDEPAGNVVLEINTNPQMSIHHFPWHGQPRNVARAVMDALFPTAVDPGSASEEEGKS